MLKKLFMLYLLLACSASLALPKIIYKKGDPYIGGALGVQNTEGYNGLFAQAFGGINARLGQSQKVYVGGELFADTGTLPLSQKYFHRTTYGFGASVIPGFILSEKTLAFIRAGIATFRFNKTNNFFTGGQLGLGLQTAINDCTDIRGEYVYTGKGIFHNFGTPRFNFFNLGILYKF